MSLPLRLQLAYQNESSKAVARLSTGGETRNTRQRLCVGHVSTCLRRCSKHCMSALLQKKSTEGMVVTVLLMVLHRFRARIRQPLSYPAQAALPCASNDSEQNTFPSQDARVPGGRAG